MGGHKRVHSSINDLPDDLKLLLDDMLSDTRYTYSEIVDSINKRGAEISRSALQRYAMRRGEATIRLQQAQEQAQALVRLIKENPDIDYTDAAMRISINGLINKISTAEEEFADIPAEKAVKLIASLSRTDAYKRRVKMDIEKTVKLALEEFTCQIRKELENYPELRDKIIEIANDVEKKTSSE